MAENTALKYSSEEKKRYEQGVADYEATLKAEEEKYSVSLERRKKIYRNFNIATYAAELAAAKDSLAREEALQEKELQAARNRLAVKLKAVVGNDKKAKDARKRLREQCEQELESITQRHEASIAAAKSRYYAAEEAHMDAVLDSQKKIEEVSRIYNDNLRRRISIQDALKASEDNITESYKDHLESLALLFDLRSRATDEATREYAENEKQLQSLQIQIDAAKAAMKDLSPDTEEWTNLANEVSRLQVVMSGIDTRSLEQIRVDYITAHTEEARTSLEQLMTDISNREEVRKSTSFAGHTVPMAHKRNESDARSERVETAKKAQGHFDVETYIKGVTEDIKKDESLLQGMLNILQGIDSSEEPELYAQLTDSISALEKSIADGKAAITTGLGTSETKGNPLGDVKVTKYVLSELGEILAAQRGGTKLEEKKDELERRRTERALKKEEEAYYKEGGGDKIDKELAYLDKVEKSEEAAKEHNAKIGEHMEQAFRSALDDLSKMIDNSIDSFFEYQASIEGRLQGSGESYKDLLKTVSSKVAVSPFVAQKDVVANIKSLVETGVSYNIELRAFLQTVSEDIAATFDAFDANMMRLIRMQQADSTAARLGMEATLTKVFNQQFKDTSYLANSISDSVSGAILEASSLLSHQNSLEFEYAVQKWLGSMYSVGVSDSTVNRIAEGLNYLGTGNVEALGSDESLQNLFAMSAARAGLPYAEMLTNGLNAEDTNKLLRSMIEYLREIASNSDNNQVTKAAYSNVFGISVADMTALNNLYDENSATLNFLTNSTLSWANALSETENQISQLGKRVHISQMIDTIVDNISSTTSIGIGGNALLYGTWKALNIVNDLTGGIKIPAIQAMGYGLASEINVLEIAKVGIAGLGFLGGLIGGLGSGGGIGGMDKLSSWGYEEQTARGKGRKAITGGVSSGFSQSEELSGVGSGSGDDVKTTSTSQAQSEASESGNVSSEEVEEGKELPKQTLEALDNGETTVVNEIQFLHEIVGTSMPVIEALIGTTNNLLREDRVFKTMSSGMNTLADLLSPNRVFYMINPTTITGESMSNVIKYDEATKSVLYDIAGNYESISADSVDIALENSKITSNLSSAMSELGLSATSIVDTASIMGYTVQSAIESSNNYVRSQLIDNLSNEISNSFKALTTGSYTTTGGGGNGQDTSTTGDEDGGEGTSTGGTGSTGGVSPAPSGSSGDDIKNIATAITALHSYIVTEKSALNVTVSNSDNMKVSLNDITTVTDPLKTVFREAVEAAISATVSGGEDDESLADRIAAAIASSPLDVRVTNDYFDTVLENKAFDV